MREKILGRDCYIDASCSLYNHYGSLDVSNEGRLPIRNNKYAKKVGSRAGRGRTTLLPAKSLRYKVKEAVLRIVEDRNGRKD